MGEKYALIQGENEDVAEAVREHYLPIQANGDLPKSQISTVVSIADKLDSVISFISVGLMPTGSQDPYSLRRQAIGVRSEEHTSELQSRGHLVCRLLLEKKQ